MSPRLAWRRPAATVTTDTTHGTEQPESTAQVEPVASDQAESTAETVALSALLKLAEYPHAIVSWVADDGYPMNVDVDIEV